MVSKQEEQDSFNFQEYSLIFKRHCLVIAVVTASIFGLTALASFKQKPIYQAEGKLLFNKTNRVSSLTSISENTGELSGVTQVSKPLDTQAEVIRSNPIVKKTIDAMNLKDKHGQPIEIDEFLKALKVNTVKDTDVLTLSYQSQNPQQAAAVVNSLMGNYLENNVQTNRTEATAAQEFLRKQLPEVEAKVMQAEAALRRFKEKNKVIVLEDEAKAGVESLKDLSDQITKATADLAEAQSHSDALQSQLQLSKQQAVALNTLSESTAVQQVLAEYQKVQDQLVVARTRYTEEHPIIKDLSSQEIALRKQLQLRVSQTLGSKQSIPQQNLQIGELKQTLTTQLVQSEIERLALANRIAVLKNAYSLSQKRLSVLPQLEQTQLQLERELAVARSTYEELLKRFQEVEVVVNQNVGNARVISPALVPKKPVSPRLTLNLALGGFLGILLGVGTALLLEARDKSLKTVEKAKQVFGYPLVGIIPHLNEKSSETHKDVVALPVRDNPYSPASAAFEMFQANLDFTFGDQLLKVIVVVSSIPGEGKSFVAANLAVAKAHMGHRVLLIDADMRHPYQHVIWQQHNLMGLSNILIGQSELSTSTQEALINLEVLHAGMIPPQPAALLDSRRMAALIEAAVRDYDFVIIDTPALNLFADGLLLSKLADGILLTVRPEILDSTAAKATKMLLEQSRSHVLGIVVNAVTDEQSSGYYHTRNSYQRRNSDRNQTNIVKNRTIF
ncbi:polysaccharide biosynthesis tyrosine autokinase [Nostoc sp. CENA67]|uniref:non-specific protein-tyrosine kinase n=1 Tax=Amazonocrinis nigriterrae CENA67 TaxID=2794033 RepID=A0A8J7HT59_9NOST|nr:polysaccharide biosynthesis tyrosine autokinase [Amazonocrinis nigriterrae]MBH8563670.1 polysaccharide biosynthesis tyrosine autokinase [Amazonocrinis nigriterrae CENA67]